MQQEKGPDMLVEITQVPQAALPVAPFKEHLRLGTGFTDDGLQDGILAGFLRAALAAVEGRTGKALIEREFQWTAPAWRGRDRQVLPVAPVSAVAEVAVLDAAAVPTVLPTAAWTFWPDMQAPSVVALSGAFPSVPLGGQVRIAFLGGFGPDWSDVPPDLQQAVLMLAAHYYEYRTDMALGSGCMPFGVTALIERYRPVRIGGAS